jgi:hypothetical protein
MPGLNRSSLSELASRLRRALLQPQASGCELLQIPNLTRCKSRVCSSTYPHSYLLALTYSCYLEEIYNQRIEREA